jgi:nucleosome binding factor SPN SPT16 subunit
LEALVKRYENNEILLGAKKQK